MSDNERVLYKHYLSTLTERSLFEECDIVKKQGELADPGLLLAVTQEFERRRGSAK